MAYQLTRFSSIIRLADNTYIPPDPANTDYQIYLAWVAAGNTAQPADEQSPAEIARETEIREAAPTARAYFAASPAAVAFIRLSPTEQAAQIDAMSLAQLKTVVKFMAVAVSALVKKEML